ncbi:hypothetical protein [Adhaeribacter pallidiroseus]|uniref:DUF1772 domain-containing protein n=1 Tax=Adhaeribacter pallidiroseus TaxID=2072847 RepID=A0A369QSQ4_9BACT|nr:hypothetical protein [Adhaeribacter pallidiroseus]RDC66247.1 hypothetical protein AHMF7616_04878 [Adhaeribacter pallidiroseus]
MSFLLYSFKNILLYLLLLVVGLYAGMHFFHEMCPVETQLTPLEYGRYWKIVDGTFMHRRMGVMGPLMIGLFVVNIALHLKNWESPTLLLLLLSFIMFLVDVGFTLTQQLPINAFINQLDLAHLTPKSMTELARAQTTSISNFQNRLVLALVSFASLSIIPFNQKAAYRTEI